MPTADQLLDAPSADELLDGKPSQAPSPTSLSKLSPLINEGINTVPGFGAVKTIAEHPFVRRMINEGGGMAAGGAIGMAAGGGPTPAGVGLSIAGSGAGNVAGGTISDIEDHPEAAYQIFKALFNPQGASQQIIQQYQKDPDGTIQAVKDYALKTGIRFTTGAAAQLLTLGMQSLVPGAGTALDVGSKAIPGVKEGLEGQNYATDPTMYTDSKVAQQVKGMAQRGILTADKMEAIGKQNEATAFKNLDDITTELSGGIKDSIPPSRLATILTQTKNLGEGLQKKIAGAMYGRADDLLSGTPQTFYKPGPTGEMVPTTMRPNNVLVSTQGLKDVANELSAQSKAINNLPAAFSDNINTALKAVQGMPDSVSFSAAHDARSALLDSIRESNNGTLISLAKRGSAALDTSMEAAAKTASPEGYQAWRDANAFYRAGKETFNNDLIAKLFLQDSSVASKTGSSIVNIGDADQMQKVMNVIDRAHDLANNPENINSLAGVVKQNPELSEYLLNNPDIKTDLTNKLKASTLQNLTGDYFKINNKSLTGYSVDYNGLRNAIDPKINPEVYGKMKVLYGQDGMDKLADRLKWADIATSKNPAAMDRAMYLAERIAGGVIGAAGGELIGHPAIGFMGGEVAGVLGMPKVAAYLITNPTGQELFMNGTKSIAQGNTKAGIDLIVKAATALGQAYGEEK